MNNNLETIRIFSEDVIPVYDTDTGEKVVLGRELHERLKIKTAYKDWFPRMCEYGFVEGTDYSLVAQKCATNNPKNPYTTRTEHVFNVNSRNNVPKKRFDEAVEYIKKWRPCANSVMLVQVTNGQTQMPM